ncbi:MAG TPA: EAL domain-containing protein [Acidimicrobiia bacterium]|nr:EAL domain-containing protein [Acidimicrobiia bacterium]
MRLTLPGPWSITARLGRVLDPERGGSEVPEGDSPPPTPAGPRRVMFAAAGAVALLVVIGGRAVIGIGISHIAGFVAVAGTLAGVVLYRRPDLRSREAGRVEPWLLIAGGVAVQAVTSAGTRIGTVPGASPTVLDILALTAYPLFTIGLLRLLSGRLPDREADVLVQAGLVATVFGLAMWAAVSPERLHNDVHLVVAVVSIALPALDLLLLTISIRLLLLPGERIFVYRGVALAVLYLFGAHVASALGAVSNWAVPADIITVLLVCSFAFWAFGALHPSMRDLFEPLNGDPPSFSSAHFVLTQMGMLAAPCVIALYAQRGTVIPGATALGAGLLAVVLSTYLGTLLWQRANIERRAHHDELTGLPNRTLFADRLNRALAHARRNDIPVVVMFVDLDRFKHVNDSFGHGVGDDLLREVARRLEKCVREEDTVARLGGDEFALLLPHISGIEGAVRIAERVLSSFSVPLSLGAQQVIITPSIGISIYPQDGLDAEHLLEGADAAMYRAKEQGRNTFEIFSPALRSQAHERLALEAALHRAIEQEELVLHYQPKVDLQTGLITGAEALVRWNHPEQGLLFPGHFIPMAEESGQVVALGELVIAAACEQLQEWQDQGLPALKVSVNVSARQLRHGLVDFVAGALRLTGLDPGCLELELTESAALESLEMTVQELETLRELGVGCSIDDFGTGYSGLAYLSRLPIDTLKIDRSFINAMESASDPIVTAIIALGHSLGLTVTAEGVETADQLTYLVQRGCDEVQGYLFSKPVPPDQFAALLRRHGAGGTDVVGGPVWPVAAVPPVAPAAPVWRQLAG